MEHTQTTYKYSSQYIVGKLYTKLLFSMVEIVQVLITEVECNGLQPSSDGMQPNIDGLSMASNPLAITEAELHLLRLAFLLPGWTEALRLRLRRPSRPALRHRRDW